MTSRDYPERPEHDDVGPPPADDLDVLLRSWHRQHADRAASLRNQLIDRLAEHKPASTAGPRTTPHARPNVADRGGCTPAAERPRHRIRRLIMNRYSAVAASLVLFAALAPLFWPGAVKPTYARDVVMAPDGGRLDALDSDGSVMGPCPLQHTDVSVDISGFVTRVTVRQQYRNPYPDKIEAVYTFPLSHRAAVDRMAMTVGDRVIIGEVHERARARAMYEAAREQGYVASLLEQERPNIFTQSVANIEPNAEVFIEISYVELLEPKDGLFSFAFPMVVGPRYVPGGATGRSAESELPAGMQRRNGIVLLAPATFVVRDAGDLTQLGQLDDRRLESLVRQAIPIAQPDANFWKKNTPSTTADGPNLWYRFEVRYPDGAREFGTLHTDGTAQINARWFCFTRTAVKAPGQGFSPDTDPVPDASRITPMPVRPGRRAGHDIAVRVTLDTGGPGIREFKSIQHEITPKPQAKRDDGLPVRLALELKKSNEIPNRDFVLEWRQTSDAIQEATFTHTGANGNFFTLILQPPDRVAEAQAVPRELIFVLDTSGSMSGFPIEKAKEVMRLAIDSLRPQDAFNLITFSGDTRILWDKPRPFTRNNRDAAQAFLADQRGGGGTEMMKAIDAALVQTPTETDRPAMRIVCFMTDGYVGNDMAIIDAVKKNARTTRVFSFGIGNSVNRYLLDSMAQAGRGEVEYVLLNEGANEKVERFVKRIQTPVLTDIQVSFGDLAVTDLIPGTIPDLFDCKPLIIHGRYTKPGKGTVTIRGRSGSGPYERTIDLELPASQPAHDTIATLWARARVEEIMNKDLAAMQIGRFPADLKQQIVELGEQYHIMTQFTSFVAVEKARVTLGGQPRLVTVPVEMPQDVSYAGIFGCGHTRLEAAKPDDLRRDCLATLENLRRRVAVRGGGGYLGGVPATSEVYCDDFDVYSATPKATVLLSDQGRQPGMAKDFARSGDNLFDSLASLDASAAGAPPAGQGLHYWGLSRQHSQTHVLREVSQVMPIDGVSAGQMKDRLSRRYSYQGPTSIGADGDSRRHALIVQASPADQLHRPQVVATLEEVVQVTGGTGGMNGMMGREDRSGNASTTPHGQESSRAKSYPDLSEYESTRPAATRPAGTGATQPTQRGVADLLKELNSDTHAGLARNALLQERIVLLVAALVRDGKLDEARPLAETFAEFDPEYAPGIQVRDTLTDAKLSAEERTARIEKLARQAQAAIDKAVREATLRTRLDPRLHAILKEPAATTAEPTPAPGDQTMTLSILVDDASARQVGALENKGLKAEAVVPAMKLIVGTASTSRLADIALADGVRRVEPTDSRRVEKH